MFCNVKGILSIFFVLPMIIFSQSGKNIELQNLAPPNSPAFVLMDVTPSNIIVPENIQAFSIQTINAFAGTSDDGFSNNNYAVEFQPYWYKKRTNMNFFKYNNLTSKKKNDTRTVDDYTGYTIFGDVWTKASFSMAFMSGTFDVFDRPQSYVSIGARTRLLSLVKKKHIDTIKEKYKAYEQFMNSPAVISIMSQGGNLDEINSAINKLEGWQKVFDDMNTIIQKKPLFALDIAVAYSHFLGDQSQDIDASFGRFGVWTSGDLAFHLPKIDPTSYFHLYGVYRYLRDGINIDSRTGNLFTENSNEYGGKIEFEIKKLSFGYEYISRDRNDESRSIGTIRYRINKALTLNGGFGENYKSDNTIVALFGIQWGLDYGGAIDPMSK